MRIVMNLVVDDSVGFAMPNHRSALDHFELIEEQVTASIEMLPRVVASH